MIIDLLEGGPLIFAQGLLGHVGKRSSLLKDLSLTHERSVWIAPDSFLEGFPESVAALMNHSVHLLWARFVLDRNEVLGAAVRLLVLSWVKYGVNKLILVNVLELVWIWSSKPRGEILREEVSHDALVRKRFCY